MSFRTSLLIDGNAKGAVEAARQAEAAIRKTGAAATGSRGPTKAAALEQRAFADSLSRTATAAALIDGPLGGVASRFSAMATLTRALPVGLIATTIGITGLSIAAVNGVRAFADYQTQMFTVQAVIDATGGAAGRTTADIDALSRKIGRDTLASTSDVRAAAAQVLTFRSISGETFDRTLTLAQDLAATGFGSISSAAVQLAKALEDPEQGLSALRRIGVSFSASQRDVIKGFIETGRAAEAQRLILDAVEQQVGGAGAAAGQGLAGAFDTLTEETGLWFELVGGKVADLTRLDAGLRGVAGAIAGVNAALEIDPGGLDATAARLQGMMDRAAQLRAELANPPPRDPQLFSGNADLRGTAARQELLILEDLIQTETGKSLAMQIAAYSEARAVFEASQRAQAQAAQDKFDAVVSGLAAETAAIAENEAVARIRLETGKAGVSVASAEGRVISNLVLGLFAQKGATEQIAKARAEATAEAERQTRAIDTLRSSLDFEIALLRAGSPAMQEQLRLRRELAGATADQRLEIIALNGIANAEREQAETGDTLAGLRAENERLRRTDLENVRADALAGLGDNATDRDRADALRLADENFALQRRRRAAGRGASDNEADGVAQLLAQLQAEADLLATTDPVQREMIRLREQLADATAAQRAEIERTIGANLDQAASVAAAAEAYDGLRDAAEGALETLIFKGGSAREVIGDLLGLLGRGALFGSGPFGGLFGGGVLEAILPQRRAAGGLIFGPGGPTEDRVPVLASPGEFITSAAATRRNLPVLEAINAGADFARFASGGPVGAAAFGASAPLRVTGGAGRDDRITVVLDLRNEMLDARIDRRASTVAATTSVAVTAAGIARFRDEELPLVVGRPDFGQVVG